MNKKSDLPVPLKVAIILAAPLLFAIFSYHWLKTAFIVPANREANETRLVEVAQGSTFRGISKDLQKQGILRHWWSLDLIARMKRKDTQINAGEYELSPSMSPVEILKKLVSGDVFKRKVTITPGMSIWEVGKFVEAAGLLSEDEFNRALTNPELLKIAGIVGQSFEGYLYPETYFFSRPIDARRIIWTMLEEGERHWSAGFSARADVIRMTRHDVVTLASIIEKETSLESEKTLVSSVFHNRLKQNMKLQADPTVIYGIPNFNGNLTKADLERDTPYNTYTRIGLPPGPICNPTESSIQAALFPEDTEYLYFVADGRGGHVFSTTLREHNRAVSEFQKLGKDLIDAIPPEPQVIDEQDSPPSGDVGELLGDGEEVTLQE